MPRATRGRTVRRPRARPLLRRRRTSRQSVRRLALRRAEPNPIIAPNPEHSWESQATFNSAAIHDGGRVHLLYRAIGERGISVLGYAASEDGIHIDERLSEPVHLPTQPFEAFKGFSPNFPFSYMSGGGYGGCEDPRITKVGERLYMTYTAFDGREPPRVALTSISVSDFRNKRWRWKRPVAISPPREQHKNWAVFPGKIRGKYAILHSLSPAVLVAYFDDLHELDGSTFIRSSYACTGRPDCWDNQVRGVGPPPIETPAGWLVLYHSTDCRDPNRYKVGAMLLDRDDPTNVRYRSPTPILEPDMTYENEGLKAGVVYTCGAVVLAGELLVYYGGADTVLCVASAPFETFVTELVHHRQPVLTRRAPRAHRSSYGVVQSVA